MGLKKTMSCFHVPRGEIKGKAKANRLQVVQTALPMDPALLGLSHVFSLDPQQEHNSYNYCHFTDEKVDEDTTMATQVFHGTRSLTWDS